MQLKYLFIIPLFIVLVSFNAFAQLTGIKTIPGDYATIQAAIAALNSAGVGSGGVTFNVAAIHTETAPANGYIITATGTSTNTIVFQGNGSTITAGLQAATIVHDAIFKIAGGDYITIQNFTMQENPGNTLSPQTMTEFGVALFLTTTTDGAQYNTIKDNTISLSPNYPNAIGILSTSSSSSTNGSLEASATTGTNSNNKFYNNTISNVAYGMYFICPPVTASIFESGIDIGGTSSATGNTITFGNATTATANLVNRFSGTLPAGITFRNGGAGNNVRYNTITSNSLAYVQSAGLGGIVTTIGTAATVVTYTSTWSDNTVTITNNGTTAITGIDFGYCFSTGTMISRKNTITLNNTTSAGSSAAIIGIKANYPSATNTLNSNTITTNQSPTTAGSTTNAITGITAAGIGTTVNVDSNSITIKQNEPTGTASYGSGAITYIAVNAASGTVNVNSNNLNTTSSSLRTIGTTYGINHSGAFTTSFSCSYNNINIDRVSTSGIFYGTNCTTSSSILDYNISHNNITLNSSSSGGTAGIFNTNGGQPRNINNNSISVTGTGSAVYGMNLTGGTITNVFDNTISNINGGGAVYGIWFGAGSSPGHIYSNNIYNLSSSSASGPVYGIRITAGTVYIYNNFISELKMPSANADNLIIGIYVPSGSIIARLFFNTIYLNAVSSGTNFGSSGIYGVNNNTLDMRNNIVINVSKPKGSGITAVFRLSGTTITGYQATSNNNCFYAGPPRSNKLIFYDGTNRDSTIAQFKSRVGPRDAASFTENVPFVNIALNNLHVKTDVPTLTESGGIVVSSPIAITEDYDGNVRNVTTPDVGADEFSGIRSTDPVPPVITYTPLGGGGIASSRNFPGVSITDIQSGVNTTSGTAPRVYFKKSTDANTVNDNTSATDGWKWVEATGTGPFDFLIDYTLLNGGSVSGGNIIQYFVVAQDLYSLPNVAINSGTFEEQPSSVNLIAANFPILGTINSYSIFGPLSGTILVGTGQSYTSLTAVDGLFNKINTSIVTGDIIVRIKTDLTETGAVALNQATEEANFKINIQPDDASTKTISGNYNGALIRLNGADNVEFDGRFSGSGNYLSFSNNAASGVIAAIQIISLGTNAGATDITIRHCNISTGFNNSLGSYAITSGGSSISSEGNDNDNLTIVDNVITKAYHGINIEATSSGVTNNITITGNIIGSETSGESVGKYGINIIQANGVNINGNSIFNIISTTEDNSYGIALWTGVTNSIISGNRIHSVKHEGTIGYGGIGIGITTGINNANILVKNNLIYDISGEGYYFNTDLWRNTHGIFLSSTQSGIKIYNNSINLYGNTLNYENAVSTGIGIGIGSLAVADIKNNIIVNNLGLSASIGYGSVGIFLETGVGQLEASSNNLIFVNPSGSGVKYIGQSNVTGYSTMQAWRLVSGKDKYSFSGDPAFISNTNLLPNNANPNCWAVNNKGMPLAIVPTDFNGAARSTTVANGPVDIGAYEFSTATTPPAAIQGGIIANDSTTTYNVFEFEFDSITWHGSGLPSDISFRYYSGIEPPGANNNTSKCYWNITQTGGGSFSYDISFNYDPAQLGVITSESDIRLAKSNDNGVSWLYFNTVGTGTNQYILNTTDKTIKVHGLNSFSLFALTDKDAPLPVELNSFTANADGRDINLKWETETEVSSYGFEIERAQSNLDFEFRISPEGMDGQNFEKIGFVAGHGNSNSPKQYSFTDNSLNSGKYIYRLKMVDNDGSYEYSPEVESEIDAPKDYLLSQNYPNPFNPATKIDYQLPFESNVTIELYNITGERVDVLVNQEQAAGYYTVEVSSTQFRLSSGVYIYRMTAVNTKDLKSYTQLKKMVVLK